MSPVSHNYTVASTLCVCVRARLNVCVSVGKLGGGGEGEAGRVYVHASIRMCSFNHHRSS